MTTTLELRCKCGGALDQEPAGGTCQKCGAQIPRDLTTGKLRRWRTGDSEPGVVEVHPEESGNPAKNISAKVPTPCRDGRDGMVGREEPGLLILGTVDPQPVRWLWPARLPLGKLIILDGDPSLGKSLITLYLAGRVSHGLPMPDGTLGDLNGPAGVVLLCAEDDPADTLRPRLDAAGADCNRIALLQTVTETIDSEYGEPRTRRRLPTLADLGAIETAIKTVDAKLVVVDPVMAYTGRAETNSDSDVRSLLAGLAALAQRTGVAVLAVRHLNKSGGGNPLYRGGGSIAFIAAARVGLLVAADPDDPSGESRVLAVTKSNLAKMPPALVYRVNENANGVAYIQWLGETEHTAKTLLASVVDDDEKGALGEAKVFLADLLEDGPVEVKHLKGEARNAGIAEKTLQRAKTALGVQAIKFGFGETGYWTWSLPRNADPKRQPDSLQQQASEESKIAAIALDGHPQSMGTLARNSNLRLVDSLPEETEASEPVPFVCPVHGDEAPWASFFGEQRCLKCPPRPALAEVTP